MSAIKFSIVAIALIAATGCAHAAGIKGRPQQAQNPQQSLKAPFQRQQPQQPQYLPPEPQQQALAPAAQQAIKAGPGQVAPNFAPARVQPFPQRQEVTVQQQEQAPQEPPQQQQVQLTQQQEELDPNAAAQEGNPALAALARPAVAAPASEEEANPRPEPYAFQYAFDSGDQATSGSSQREEQQDASGRVTGFYTLKGEDGRDRRVDYVADASGFRATISTNELGTAPKDSADVDWNAQNPSDAQLRSAEAATQAARARALANPQQQQISQIAESRAAAGSSSNFSKLSAPRQQKTSPAAAANQQQQQANSFQQLQEPFEQIRQTELNGRARRASRHAPFYLFTV